MKYFYFLILFVCKAHTKFVDKEKVEFCGNFNCKPTHNKAVCGMRQEGDGFRLKIFHSECELMKFGCQVEDNEAYGLINLEYCQTLFPNYFSKDDKTHTKNKIEASIVADYALDLCTADCTSSDLKEVCGIRQEGQGFKVRWFLNNCELTKYNCINNLKFEATDSNICEDLAGPEHDKSIINTNEDIKNGTGDTEILQDNVFNATRFETYNTTKISEDLETSTLNNDVSIEHATLHKNLVVLDGSMLNYNGNINETMDNFFAMTHVFDLPIKDVDKENELNEEARRMLLNVFKPVKVYKPWIEIPKNISTDRWHEPTLSTCYHKCPKKCPDTYAPVCGVPGIVAREPTLMFKNHCYMDVAQCKMRWEDKSDTAASSAYIESSFLICLGDALSGMYRFLPLVRTLQHMGRLKKKGRFQYKMRNMGFFNQILSREPRLMG